MWYHNRLSTIRRRQLKQKKKKQGKKNKKAIAENLRGWAAPPACYLLVVVGECNAIESLFFLKEPSLLLRVLPLEFESFFLSQFKGGGDPDLRLALPLG